MSKFNLYADAGILQNNDLLGISRSPYGPGTFFSSKYQDVVAQLGAIFAPISIDGTVKSVNISTSTDGLTVGGGPITDSGTLTVNLNSELQALSEFSSVGIMTLTAANTYSARTIVGESGEITILNGNGVSGNPTVGLTNTAVTPGSYTNSNITINSKGQITSASSGSAPITSISGTSNRITVSGTLTPTIDISSAYIGQNTITTLGTITTGIWSGTAISMPKGGTGLTTTTAYGIICGGTTATGVFQNAGAGTANQIFTSNGASALGSWKNTIDDLVSLDFTNTISSRKLVFYDGQVTPNNHQFYGEGISAGVLESHIGLTSDEWGWLAATSSTASNRVMTLTGTGFLGIGTSSPHAPLQFANADANRKSVFYEAANNDHQIIALGTAADLFKLQLNASTTDFSINIATSSSASNEKFRFTGTGFLGINVSDPHAPIHLANVISASRRQIILSDLADNEHQFGGMGYKGGEFSFHLIANGSEDFVWYAAQSASVSDELVRLTGTGFLGIGTSSPHAPLQFESSIGEKIRLYEVANNQHQVLGFRIDSGSLAVQIHDTAADCVFFAGTSTTTSNTIFKLKGTGGYAQPTGTNKRAGQATLGAGGTITIPNNTITSNTRANITLVTAGGTIGTIRRASQIASTSITFTSTNVLDTSIFDYELYEIF